jgi:hypothetical protein
MCFTNGEGANAPKKDRENRIVSCIVGGIISMGDGHWSGLVQDGGAWSGSALNFGTTLWRKYVIGSVRCPGGRVMGISGSDTEVSSYGGN